MKTPLTAVERIVLERLFYGVPLHAHVNVSSFMEVRLLWDDGFTTENGKLGSFWFGRPNDICLSPVGKRTPELLLGVLFHELHHRWQFQTYGVLYVLMLVPGVRQCLLEPSAYRIEAEVDALLLEGGKQ